MSGKPAHANPSLKLSSAHFRRELSEYVRAQVVGHGMNAQELIRNPQLSEFFVRVGPPIRAAC